MLVTVYYAIKQKTMSGTSLVKILQFCHFNLESIADA